MRNSILSLVVSFLVVSPALADKPAAPKPDPVATGSRYENLELLQKVLHYVESNYVEATDNRKLIHGAIRGMLETLDPHSNFLPAEVFKDMKVDTSGRFGGLGIEVGMRDNVLTVISPIEDTPAWRAGIRPGDRIVRINGESTKGLTLAEAVTSMRGKRGSAVKLTVYREADQRLRDFSLVRELVKIQSVKHDLLEPGIGYVRLTSFNENAASDIRQAIEKIEKAGKLKGLVLDLRNNPGGLLDQAVEVSSLFIDEGVVVSTAGRNPETKEVKMARKGMARKDLAVVVLVNSSTASAAEIVAGALQDHKRALILGQPTFGKGSVQSVVEIAPEVGLKLTIARYYTPSGKSIQEKGVSPDILLEDFDSKVLAEARKKQESLREKDLKGHMVNPEGAGSSDSKRPDFMPEELETLGSAKGAQEKKGESSKQDDEPLRIQPKEDFQVRQAAGYLKSFEVFRDLKGTVGPQESTTEAAAKLQASGGT